MVDAENRDKWEDAQQVSDTGRWLHSVPTAVMRPSSFWSSAPISCRSLLAPYT